MTYNSDAQIEAVVRGFESCETSGDAFTHADHLVVAAFYLRENCEEVALAKMRQGLLRFLTYHGEGTQKYNETITLFWLKRVNHCLETCERNEKWYCKVNHVVKELGDSRLVFHYYSSELLNSPAAKNSWSEPDVKEL
jgi:hypothetical protein